MTGAATAPGKVLIGTSGWSYGHWRHCFYPPEIRQAGWLEYYSRFLSTVEINATFYRLPGPEYVERWRGEVPADFVFAVKGSRYLTHTKRLGDHGEALDRFMDMAALLGDKCGPILWQLPPQMKRDDDRLAAFAGALPGNRRHAFEFRDPGWYCDAVYDILGNAGAALCIPDHPDRHKELLLTAPWTYIRLHYSGKDGLYSSAAVAHWAGVIAGFAREGVDVYAYFNNDQKGFGIRNALELKESTG